MFSNLFNLYKSSSVKTPMEDFTTEAFAGILKIEQDIKNAFIEKVLKIDCSGRHFEVKTQVRYSLEKPNDCIVDLVFEDSENKSILFVEVKVNSVEGHQQLERYRRLLDIYIDNGYQQAELFYLTKYAEEKDYITKHIRWYEVAKFLKNYCEINLIKDFYKFLNKYDMDQELTFTAKDFVSIENAQNFLNLITEHLTNIQGQFYSEYAKPKITDGITVSQIKRFNRVSYYYTNVVEGKAWTETMYGFNFSESCAFVSIYMDKGNENHDTFLEEIKEWKKIKEYGENLIVKSNKTGASISVTKNISFLLNNESGEDILKNWFFESFKIMEEFIDSTSDKIKWKLKRKTTPSQ